MLHFYYSPVLHNEWIIVRATLSDGTERQCHDPAYIYGAIGIIAYTPVQTACLILDLGYISLRCILRTINIVPSNFVSMSLNLSSIISELQKSKLFAECPHCHQEFILKNQIMFDGRKKFPSEAEVVKLEWLKQVEDKKQELEKRQITADKGAEKKAIEIGIGKIIEKVIPAYKNFNLPLSDCRFLG